MLSNLFYGQATTTQIIPKGKGANNQTYAKTCKKAPQYNENHYKLKVLRDTKNRYRQEISLSNKIFRKSVRMVLK